MRKWPEASQLNDVRGPWAPDEVKSLGVTCRICKLCFLDKFYPFLLDHCLIIALLDLRCFLRISTKMYFFRIYRQNTGTARNMSNVTVNNSPIQDYCTFTQTIMATRLMKWHKGLKKKKIWKIFYRLQFLAFVIYILPIVSYLGCCGGVPKCSE